MLHFVPAILLMFNVKMTENSYFLLHELRTVIFVLTEIFDGNILTELVNILREFTKMEMKMTPHGHFCEHENDRWPVAQ